MKNKERMNKTIEKESKNIKYDSNCIKQQILI
jgi:hypothetical protein